MKSFYDKECIEAGCDEAGRGCLAGPVFASAVILPFKFRHPLLNDSKQVSEENRNKLRMVIERKALAWAVAQVDNIEIDTINILRASIKAMHLAVASLKLKPQLLLIDGNQFDPYLDLEHVCIIQGDEQYASIAAASILAKTHRDEFMRQLHCLHPQYHWSRNKGYPTQDHRLAISQFGLTPYHRLSFRQLPDLPAFDF